MHTETITGLHRCQPKNEPEVGQVKTFLVIRNPARNGKKAWIAIKSAPEDKGGTPYKIVDIVPTGWEPDTYGNVSYNLEIEPTPEAYECAIPQKRSVNAPESPVRSFNGLDERQRAIIRQHSQSMALEVLKLKVTLNELTVEDLTPAKLRALADYFDADVLGATE